ncbi:MAG TPA: transcription antitermination factor NusB [Verrucomicrobiales bacterium]|nr:transcription antitermination factor NusB [Verrucomicrobiales bacterium]HRJ08004.1 transcription antitermination factor NusB [Prosthecobacter sp.]HRK12671.1 transcription antitermination factor NusB [Prosthecobacter sp.]
MGKRREGRAAAVQYLFARELQGEGEPANAGEFWSIHSAKASVRSHAESLAQGVLSHLDEIDAHIRPVLDNFRIERLAAVDRNILRLAVHELLHLPDVPGPVVINEAIEIAKSLGGGESGSFVNGILHKIAQKVRKPVAAEAPGREGG